MLVCQILDYYYSNFPVHSDVCITRNGKVLFDTGENGTGDIPPDIMFSIIREMKATDSKIVIDIK